jgi:hypothetical protein
MHPPRKVELFRTQMRSMDKVIEQIKKTAWDLGSDPEKDLQVTYNEGSQSVGKEVRKLVFAAISLKVYWYKTEYYIMVEKHVDWFDRSIDDMAAIHKFLHQKLMNLVQGLESIEEAFGSYMVLSQSKLPPAATERLISGPKAPFKFDRLLSARAEVK